MPFNLASIQRLPVLASAKHKCNSHASIALWGQRLSMIIAKSYPIELYTNGTLHSSAINATALFARYPDFHTSESGARHDLRSDFLWSVSVSALPRVSDRGIIYL